MHQLRNNFFRLQASFSENMYIKIVSTMMHEQSLSYKATNTFKLGFSLEENITILFDCEEIFTILRVRFRVNLPPLQIIWLEVSIR